MDPKTSPADAGASQARMRLLTRDVDGKIVFQTFTKCPDVPYAIFSYTYGADRRNNVTFAEINLGINVQSNSSYKSLDVLIAKALASGPDHFWTASCCIDWSNENEVSAALKSIFEVYANATKLIVHLPDVSAESLGQDGTNLEVLHEAIKTSSWFKQVWSVTELLAVLSVEILDAEGVWLGDKLSLAKEISEATTIPEDMLLGRKKLPDYTESERMTWARNRNAEKPEDAAYALMGLFGVQMEVKYGEGRDKALGRLKQEIKKSIRTRTLQDFDKYSRISGTLPDGRKYSSFISTGLHYMLDRSDACFYCGKRGHYEGGCYTSTADVRNYRRGAGLCYQCGSHGHEEEFCPWSICRT